MGVIVEAFEQTVRNRGPLEAIWSRGEGLRLSFDQVAARVDRWTERLVRAGDADGPTALGTANIAAFNELFLSLRRLERTVVLIDSTLAEADRLDLCRLLGVPTLIHRGEVGRPLGDDVRIATVTDLGPVRPPVGTALVKLTSGSTGKPEGICLDEEALLVGIGQIATGMSITAEDRVLVSIPLSHSYGFDNGVLSLAVIGTALVLEPQVYPAPLLKALGEGAVTFFPTVPPLVRVLGAVDWPEGLPLRTVICAGGPLAPEIATAFYQRSGRPVHQFYGSTETGGITYEREPRASEASGTVGHPLPGVEVTIGTDSRVTVVSGANFGGYLGRDHELTSRAVVTGDQGEWTEENRLRLVGRAGDFVNVGGRKISVLAVERQLHQMAGVRDVAVVGTADEVRGDRLVAFVVPASPGLVLAPDRLPAGLAPRQVSYLEALPYTDRGKLDRRRLHTLAAGRDHE